MPLNTLVYLVLLIGCCGYAFLRGGGPEKIGAAILAIGSFLTLIALSTFSVRYSSVEVGVFLVDVATLVAFLALALRAERHWTLWVAALQIIGTAAHAVKLVDHEIIRRAYAIALVFWSYPMLALIVLGTWRHQQRLVRFGSDRSWSSSSARSAPPAPPGAGPTA